VPKSASLWRMVPFLIAIMWDAYKRKVEISLPWQKNYKKDNGCLPRADLALNRNLTINARK